MSRRALILGGAFSACFWLACAFFLFRALTGCAVVGAWPAPRVEFVPAGAPIPAGAKRIFLATCCGSMRPLIQGGEAARVSPWDGAERLTGHVVATPEATHLVTAETADAVLTAGIMNRHSDGWTPKARLLYVVRQIERR